MRYNGVAISKFTKKTTFIIATKNMHKAEIAWYKVISKKQTDNQSVIYTYISEQGPHTNSRIWRIYLQILAFA